MEKVPSGDIGIRIEHREFINITMCVQLLCIGWQFIIQRSSWFSQCRVRMLMCDVCMYDVCKLGENTVFVFFMLINVIGLCD